MDNCNGTSPLMSCRPWMRAVSNKAPPKASKVATERRMTPKMAAISNNTLAPPPPPPTGAPPPPPPPVGPHPGMGGGELLPPPFLPLWSLWFWCWASLSAEHTSEKHLSRLCEVGESGGWVGGWMSRVGGWMNRAGRRGRKRLDQTEQEATKQTYVPNLDGHVDGEPGVDDLVPGLRPWHQEGRDEVGEDEQVAQQQGKLRGQGQRPGAAGGGGRRGGLDHSSVGGLGVGVGGLGWMRRRRVTHRVEGMDGEEWGSSLGSRQQLTRRGNHGVAGLACHCL